jgi:hypothetical protein
MRGSPVQTMNPTTARSEVRTHKRRLIAACLAVALLAGLGGKLWLDHRVPSPDAEAGRLSRYMASPAFAALPDAQKAPYLDAFQRANDRGELTPEQQRDVIFNRSEENPIQRYFSLSPKEREKFMDEVIDRAEKDDKRRPPQDKEGAKEIPIDSGRLADSIPPEDRARMDQFMQDLHDRRVARGLPDNGKFLLLRTH